MFLEDVTAGEVDEINNRVSENKALIIDNISAKIFKPPSSVLIPFIFQLYKVSFSAGTFLDCLNFARVTPEFNSRTKMCPRKYPLISTLPVLSKFFEKAFSENFFEFLDKNGLLTMKHFGLGPKRATIEAMAEITEKLRLSSQNMKQYSSFFLDLKEALDTKSNQRLIMKMELYGVRGIGKISSSKSTPACTWN